MGQYDGLTLDQFPDFVASTREHYDLTPDVLNETARQGYEILDLISGQEERKIIQSGSSINSFLRLKKHNAAQHYKPNQELEPKGMNVLSELKVPWRFSVGNFAWAEETVDLNGGGVEKLVDMLDEWRGAMKQDIIDLMEEDLFAEPDYAGMEVAGGDKPYSYLSFITPAGTLPWSGSGETTLQGLADHANYRNQTETYTSTSADTINSTLELAFQSMWLKLRWRTPPKAESWYQSSDWRKFKILTSIEGVKAYLSATVLTGARLMPEKDPGNYVASPTYANIPIEAVPAITEKAYTNPEYYWRDGRYIHPVFHSKRFLQEQKPIQGGSRQPFSWVVYNKSYWNLICKSRKRLGYVGPSAAN